MRRSEAVLHTSHVDEPMATINRILILAHATLTIGVLYYRGSSLPNQPVGWPLASRSLLFGAELLLAFLWSLRQAFKWRPVVRAVFPERLLLPSEERELELPPVDVFVCTADPEMEPTMEVMNTLISATCLDYPADRLNVYLSDDGGSALTLHAARMAYAFAAPWRAFCQRFGVETSSPEAYFSDFGSDQSAAAAAAAAAAAGGGGASGGEFLELQQRLKRLKLMYESLKERVDNAKTMSKTTHGSTAKGQDRLPHIEVIQVVQETEVFLKEQEEMPLLVYVSREKKNTSPHHYKAGALNVLLRVSSVMSNSPYILVLDCDMYCNNPTSARQAMCFHLDPHLAPSLAFVQFPQCFHNLSKNDIYCAELAFIFKRLWKGCDGLRGPVLSGTGFYIKRDALYGTKPDNTTIGELASSDISKLKQLFGSSNELIASLRRPNLRSNNEKHSSKQTLTSEATILASCAYEVDTQWGEQIGFLYGSVVEDYFTGFVLHCRGWTSAYCFPERPAFLGSVPVSFNDTLIQNKRWAAGLLEVGFSRFSPLIYGPTKRNSVPQSMCYAWLAFWPMYSLALLCYGTIPQLCFMNGVYLFPPVSSPWFAVFVTAYACSLCQLLVEICLYGGSIRSFINEVRWGWIISMTSHLFACLSLVMKLVGIREIKFDLTNKVTGEEEEIHRYERGIFDFEGSSMVLVPATTLAILNVITLVIGWRRMIVDSSLHDMFGQLILSLLILAVSYRVLEAMFVRRDKGRVPASISLVSIILAEVIVLLC